ncbi:hypothetical protein N9N08_01225, partial [bacterium]|nr:hypothetical protein [bacterium]
FEKNKNYYHTWRKKGYKQIVNRFNRIYGYSWKDLIDQDKFIQGDGDVYQKLKNIGIEISHKGDSRKGAPGQDDLFPEEDTKNPKSGEPLNRSSGISWENMDDEAEKKRFDAFDWEHYPAKMKDVVAKEMANNERSFKVALENILKKVLDGKVEINPEDMGKPLDKLATAAGIDPLDGGSSNGIASKTDWGNLADHLGIERGVNDQGVTLLAKAYTQFDGNHEWRPAETDEDGQNVIGLQRWAAAVREAEKYIRDNYNVSDGNYFRKNADGSDGDDVSSMYSKDDRTISTPPENEFDSDYDKARANHPSFNTMMQRGMQDYLARGQVNDLVGFLNNPSNDNVFKSRVLGTIMNRGDMENGPFASFQDALAVTRRQGNESVFAKFDKLSLSEKLHLVNQSKVLEGTRSFKGNKKKGKGFEHPNKSGKKAKYVEGALPDNSVVRILNKLLSEPMPASDIKKQMDAYFAIPDPTMLTNFRQRRAEGGDNICLRPVLRSFIKQQLDPSSQKQVNLNEGILKEDIDSYDQERLDYIINTIKNSPEFIKKIYRYIKVDPDHDGRIDPEELLSKERTKPETDHLATKEILKAFIDALMKTPGDLDDLESFLYTYGKVSYIDTKKLMSGKSSWDDWIVGSPNVSKEFIESLYINLFNFTPNVANSDRGPGELGLALLSPNIKIASVGDISVDGVEVEVKGERSTGGGRLRNSNDDFGNPNWKDFFNKYDVPEELRITNASGNSAPQKIHFLDVAKKLEEFKPGAGKEYIKVLLNGIYIYADQRLKDKLINASLNLNYAENFLEIAKIAFNNYANILKGKGFEDILMINLPHKNSLAFKASNVNDNLENFKFSSLDFGDPRNGGAIQVSMKK